MELIDYGSRGMEIHGLRGTGRKGNPCRAMTLKVSSTQWTLHDLAVHAIARHTGLGCPAVAAHLQANQTLALPKLLF